MSHTFLCRSPSIFCLQAGERNCPASAWKLGFNLRTKWQIWRACVFVKVGEIRTSMRTAANRISKEKTFQKCWKSNRKKSIIQIGRKRWKRKNENVTIGKANQQRVRGRQWPHSTRGGWRLIGGRWGWGFGWENRERRGEGTKTKHGRYKQGQMKQFRAIKGGGKVSQRRK